VAHEHHAATVEGRAQRVEGVLDLVAAAVGGLLQLAQLQRAVGAEENRLDRG
jgi:hypothetical protein